jgi:hypothetical protein
MKIVPSSLPHRKLYHGISYERAGMKHYSPTAFSKVCLKLNWALLHDARAFFAECPSVPTGVAFTFQMWCTTIITPVESISSSAPAFGTFSYINAIQPTSSRSMKSRLLHVMVLPAITCPFQSKVASLSACLQWLECTLTSFFAPRSPPPPPVYIHTHTHTYTLKCNRVHTLVTRLNALVIT